MFKKVAITIEGWKLGRSSETGLCVPIAPIVTTQHECAFCGLSFATQGGIQTCGSVANILMDQGRWNPVK
jgi:hypothetical protein